MKRKFFLLLDTETCQNGKVFDFAVQVIDRKGKIHSELAVLIPEFYKTGDFFNRRNIGGIFDSANMPKRLEQYENLIDSGSRLFACSL